MKGQVILLGDIHGKFNTLRNLIERYNIGNNNEITYLIHVGDFGIGFNPDSDSDLLNSLNDYFKSRNIVVLAIRGNHDNPFYFNGDHLYSNLKLLPDYTTLTINDKNYLFVGGAISVDRLSTQRKDEECGFISYWVEEKFNYIPEKINKLRDINVVITHTAPDWCYPDNRQKFNQFIENCIEKDKTLEKDLLDERLEMSRMFQHLKNNGNNIELHAYGHFHKSQDEFIYYTKHWLLNINEFKEIR